MCENHSPVVIFISFQMSLIILLHCFTKHVTGDMQGGKTACTIIWEGKKPYLLM